jgi:hypothetical protein
MKKLIWITAVLLMLSLTVVGCGSDAEEETTVPGTSEVGSTEQTQGSENTDAVPEATGADGEIDQETTQPAQGTNKPQQEQSGNATENEVTGELTQEQINQIWLYAGNHIGQFVRWIIDRGFEGEDAEPELCEKVRRGEMSGTEYLMINCDGKLWESDIREDVLPFVMAYYYDESGEYLTHYADCCLDDDDKPCYGVITGNEDYRRLKAKIDDAYARFVAER